MSSTKPFWPARRWWMALLAILICASALRFTGYSFSLPYVDHVDEPAYNLAGRMIIDFGSAKPIGMHGYPPGIVTLNYILLRWFHDPVDPPAVMLGWLRLVSISFSVGTVLITGLLGYRVATPLAGLLAAGLWTFMPVIVEHSRYATADNFVTFFAMLGVFGALSGALYDRDKWVTGSVVAMIFAIAFKYQAIFILPLVLAVPLVRLLDRRDGARARRILRNNVGNIAILGVFFFWLIVIFPALEATASPDWSAPTERLSLPTFDVLYENLKTTMTPLWHDVLWPLGLIGLIILLHPALRRHVSPFGLVALFVGAVMWEFGVSLYGYQGFRQFISAGVLMTVMMCAGLAAWGLAFGESIRQRSAAVRPQQRLSLLGAAALTAVIITLSWPNIEASVANARNHTLPDRRNDLATYMDTSVPSGPYISDDENHKTFNRDWGGYPGANVFPFLGTALVTDRPLEEWREEGVEYAIVPYYIYEEMKYTPEGQAYLNEMLLLKAYPPSREYRGPSMVVFRLYPMDHRDEIDTGPVDLVGYDIDHTEVQPGETITFRLYWETDQAPSAEYAVYNHLVPMDSREMVAQVDGPPLHDLRRTTVLWTDPDETLISRPFTLTVGEGVPPGEYRLITGFYRLDTFERLINRDGDDFQLVTTIDVVDS